MYIIPSTPFTCCSIGAATVSATVSALAPGYCPVMLITGCPCERAAKQQKCSHALQHPTMKTALAL
jgi:hypothetical protein